MSLRASLARPLGLRREVAILVPASLFLLLALAGFTLLSYRSAVDLLVEARRDEALAVARATATEITAGGTPAAELSALRRRLPAVRTAVLADAAGRVVAVSGEEPAGGALAPFPPAPGTPPAAGAVAGPDHRIPGAVAARVPVRSGGQTLHLRVDLEAPVLAGQLRGLRVLTWVVVGVGLGAGLLLVLFLRQLLRPMDAMLARARELSGDGADEWEDEVALLVRTFERGVAALATAGSAPGVGGGTEVGPGTPDPAPDRDLEALQRTLAASLESGLLLLDGQGRVVALNDVGERLLGVPAPAPGAPLERALAGRPEVVGLLADAVARRRSIQRHEVTLAADSGPRTLGLTVHPLRRSGGAPGPGEAAPDGGAGPAVRGFLVLFADLTEARRRGEEARLADSLVRLGELAAGVAHELRNSLATLRGYLALLERRPGDAAEGYLAEMRHEADHLQRVLEDFLSFARPGSVRPEDVSLAAVARRAALDPALEGQAVEVVETPPGGGALRGDPQLLERAVRNLLRNAAEAQRSAAEQEGAAPGPVVVRVADAEVGGVPGVELVVEDRGDGVPAEMAGRLFDPFVTGRPDGVGLGLALTQRIVALHGGRLGLEPRPGGGTRAVLWLPAGRIVTDGNDPVPPRPAGGAPSTG